MASNNEGQSSGDCDNVYLAAEEFLREANDQQLETETDIETGAETLTGAETETGMETGAKTSGAGIESKAKR